MAMGVKVVVGKRGPTPHHPPVRTWGSTIGTISFHFAAQFALRTPGGGCLPTWEKWKRMTEDCNLHPIGVDKLRPGGKERINRVMQLPMYLSTFSNLQTVVRLRCSGLDHCNPGQMQLDHGSISDN